MCAECIYNDVLNLPNMPQSNETKSLAKSLESLYGAMEHFLAILNASSFSTTQALLSISQLRGLYTSIEIIWELTLSPRISSVHRTRSVGVGSYPKSLLLDEEKMLELRRRIRVHPSDDAIFSYFALYCRLCQSIFLRHFVLDRNVTRLLQGIWYFQHFSSRHGTGDVENLSQWQSFLLCGEYSVIAVHGLRNLVVHASGQLKTFALHTLTNLLVSDTGFEVVLHSLTEEKLDDRAEAMLVMLIVSPPRDIMKPEYFAKIGELCWKQVALSADYNASPTNKFGRICAMALLRIAGIQPPIIEDLIQKHFKWLLMFYPSSKATSVTCDRASAKDLSQSVHIMHVLLNSAPFTRSFVLCLLRTHVVKAAIDILIHLLTKSVVSYLRPLAQESVTLIFRRLEEAEAVDLLLSVMLNSPRYVFRSGENGGLWICANAEDTSQNSCNIHMSQLDCDDIGDMLQCGNKLVTDLVCRAIGVAQILRTLPVPMSEDAEYLPSAIFLHVLERYFDIKIDKEMKLKYGTILLVLKSQLEVDMLLGNGLKILDLLRGYIERYASDVQQSYYLSGDSLIFNRQFYEEEYCENTDHCDDKSCDNDITSIEIVFAILHSLLSIGSKHRQPIEEECLKSMVPRLGVIAKYERNIDLSDEAVYLASKILSRPQDNVNAAENIGLTSTESDAEAIDDCLTSSCAAKRAFGVNELLSKLKYNNEVLPGNEIDGILKRLLVLLKDEESFVYLLVIRGLVAVASLDVRRFLSDFADWYACGDINQYNIRLNARERSLLGEVLVQLIQREPDLIPDYASLIIYRCIRMARKKVHCQKSQNVQIDILRGMKVLTTNDNAEDIASTISCADEVLLRQSAISVLAAAVSSSGWHSRCYLHDCIDVAIGILQLESASDYEAITSRRSAAIVLKCCIDKLRNILLQDAIKISSTTLRDIYRVVKSLAWDCDSVVISIGSTILKKIDDLVLANIQQDDYAGDLNHYNIVRCI